jgi:hypothetical protein
VKARINSSDFTVAIRESLASLIQEKKPISQTSVIKGARTKDGKSVGLTTLYRKNDKTGEYVHQELINEIELAKNNLKKRKGKKTQGETIVGIKKEKAIIEKERQNLIDRVVEQENEIRQLSNGKSLNNSQMKTLEGELYVAHSVLVKQYPSLHSMAELCHAFEQKNSGTEELEYLKKRIDLIAADINYSTVFNANFGKKNK